MNFTIARDKLAFLLQIVLRAVPTRTTLPAIKGCLIEALSDSVVFAGTNLDWGVKVSVDAGVMSSGAVVVSAKLLDEIVRTFPNSDVTIALDESAWSLSVTSGSSQMVLNALPPDDFPKWPETSSGEKIVLPAGAFRDLVKAGATCAVNNPARPLWGACLLDIKEDSIAVVSTDQFALSRARSALEARPGRAIIPADVLQDIARLSDSVNAQEVSLEITPNYIYFLAGDISCFCRLIEGQYYAYEQVIPKTFTSEVTVSTQALIGAAQRASIVASEEDRAMRIILDKERGSITVKAGSPEKGRMEENMPATISGENIEIYVQHKYILQALGRITTEETFLGMTGQVKPMRIEPSGKTKSSPDITFVVMPMSPKGAF